jgi:hypothetical protein
LNCAGPCARLPGPSGDEEEVYDQAHFFGVTGREGRAALTRRVSGTRATVSPDVQPGLTCKQKACCKNFSMYTGGQTGGFPAYSLFQHIDNTDIMGSIVTEENNIARFVILLIYHTLPEWI